ncbi:aspartate carbamoyltransferase catalytic subunit [Paenalkalicoccus suaedae]|uniref:Aspartate carbamoyltransferase n=1 Tax=Paenalkalicoccus suaedae TaxID=2592382 RepID=A0A859FEX0_9BACI|nr:aspartate carbamoyltransferase catalytic subunit [Paenalkalicoccus suaedae]QKS71501.1 aspartate carbamoyltransferase catalytic subunit [Paenalkalicoccus suaedae]
MKHFLTLDDFSVREIEELLNLAEQDLTLKGTVANLFFEPSTRTKYSFEMAQYKLGLHPFDFTESQSSTQKGETLYDTVKTLEAIGVDAVVIRHPQNAFYQELSGITIPIINAGDGTGNHPSQTLLDLLTIKQEFGHFQGLDIVIAGDISHSRVAHSTSRALLRLGANVTFVGPQEWGGSGVSMDDATRRADVVMLLRVQTERHQIKKLFTKEDYHTAFGLTVKREKRMQDHAIIMHPAPVNRDVEIASELVECERSRIFKQMQNGVLARKAIMWQLLHSKGAVFA